MAQSWNVACRRRFLLALLAPFIMAGCASSGSDSNIEANPTPPTRSATASTPQSAPATIGGSARDVAARARQAANRAWKTASRIHTEAAYEGFATNYAKDPRAAKAKARAGELGWRHAQRVGTTDAYQAFRDAHPNDPHAGEARQMAKGVEISLADAIRRGWVSAHPSGNGLQSISLTIKRRIHRPLRVTVPAGTYFVCQGDAQNMVACESNTVDLTDSASADLTVVAACANFYREQPGGDNTFSVRAAHPSRDLRRLLAVIAKKSPGSMVSQLAIWSITDNPSRFEAESHTIPGPDTSDFTDAAALLREAGIRPASRRMFRKGGGDE